MPESSDTQSNIRKRVEDAIASHGSAAAAVQSRLEDILQWFNSLPACNDVMVQGELNEPVLWALRLYRSSNRWNILVAFAVKPRDDFPNDDTNWENVSSLSIQRKAAILEHLPKLAAPLIEYYETQALPLQQAVADFDNRAKAIGLNLTEGK